MILTERIESTDTTNVEPPTTGPCEMPVHLWGELSDTADDPDAVACLCVVGYVTGRCDEFDDDGHEHFCGEDAERSSFGLLCSGCLDAVARFQETTEGRHGGDG